MKKNILPLMLMAAFIFFTACDKENDPAITEDPTSEPAELQVESTSTAEPEDDNKSSGIYKGSFVGSSGSFKITLTADVIGCVLTVDGVAHNLTSNDITGSDLGNAISNALFSDAKGEVNLTFSVDANGENPVVSLKIEGHSNIETIVFKETSSNQIKVYEGYSYDTYPSRGVQCIDHINIILGANNVAKVAFKSSGNSLSLNNGNSGSCDEESWSSDYIYKINGSAIEIYNLVREDPDDPATEIKDELLEGTVSFSDEQIYSLSEWTDDDGFNYADSARLIRKL